MGLSESVTASDFGSVFPPRDEHDVLAYDPAGVRAGYLAHAIGIASPTPDAGAAFRWGWATRAKDLTLSLDGFEDMRLAAARLKESGHGRSR